MREAVWMTEATDVLLQAVRSSHEAFQQKPVTHVSKFHDEIQPIFEIREQIKKRAKKLYKIGEVAKACGVPRTTVRYYTQRGLITAEKAPNGYWYYNDNAIILVKFILMHAQQTKMYLEGIKRLIEETPFEEIARQVKEWEKMRYDKLQ